MTVLDRSEVRVASTAVLDRDLVAATLAASVDSDATEAEYSALAGNQLCSLIRSLIRDTYRVRVQAAAVEFMSEDDSERLEQIYVTVTGDRETVIECIATITQLDPAGINPMPFIS